LAEYFPQKHATIFYLDFYKQKIIVGSLSFDCHVGSILMLLH